MIARLLIAAVLALGPVTSPVSGAQGYYLEPVGVYTISAYSYEEGGGENYFTAGGWTPVPYYTVGASEEFELGTFLYIEGIGEVQVQDRGAFPGNRIDLHIGHDDPEEFGLQEREVWIIHGK